MKSKIVNDKRNIEVRMILILLEVAIFYGLEL